MPTDPKALVGLLMYMEKHFSILPQEINGQRSWGLLGGMAQGRPRDFRRQPITSSSPPLFSIAHRLDFKRRTHQRPS
jgi:hypothetical protein